MLVGLVALLLQKSIYTQELEIARMKRRVLFLELDSLFQGVKKQAATLNESQLEVQWKLTDRLAGESKEAS